MPQFLSERNISIALVAAILLAAGLASLTITGVIGGRRPTPPAAAYEDAGLAAEPASFGDLQGWRLDDAAETLGPLLRSCARLSDLPDDAPVNAAEALGSKTPTGLSLAGEAGDWREVCAEAARVAARPYADANARTSGARGFYENYFRPVRFRERRRAVGGFAGAADKLSARGRFTAYFEPFYEASAVRTQEFSAPVYARPLDLVVVDLGRFRKDLAGQRLAGMVVDGQLDPYPDHAAINAGAVSGRARVIAYMRPTDLLFLQIQGSGRLAIDGRELRVGYDGANGRPYTAVGKTLIERGSLTRDTVSMKTIRDWLDAAPAHDAQKVRESNASYVFFRTLDTLPDNDLGPLGAEGVQLTPGRSLAVDPRYTPFGAPVWLSIDGDPSAGKEPVRRLLIAQDSGGAIKGPVRGDIFVGSGPRAGDVAGGFNEIGEMYVLLPTALADRLVKKTRH